MDAGFFLWCTILNGGVLILGFLAMVLMGDFVYRMHTRVFRMPRETFNAVFYGLLGLYKLLILVFCLVPWLALLIAGR